MSEPEEVLLAHRCARGEEAAMRQVFERHEPRLRILASRLLGDPRDAEEIAASTFLRFWKSASRFRGETPLKVYLTQICLNLCRDRLRKKPRPTVSLGECESAALWETSEEDDRLELIRQGLLSIPAEDREILTLYYMDDLDYEELCSSLGIGYDVLRTRLVRARKRLRAVIGAEE